MNKRILFLLIITITFSFIFTACGKNEKNDLDKESKEDIQEKVENIEKSEASKKEVEEDIIEEIENIKEEIKEYEEKEKEEEEEKAPIEEKPDVTTADFGDFNDLDNTKNAWWFRRAQNNNPAYHDKPIEDLLKKYDGIYLEHTDEKVIYLTFDEGYEMGYTPSILDTLKNNDVKAAFFITGAYLDSHPELVKRMVDEGHIVGNHTVNHPSLPEVKSYKTLEDEIIGLERDYYELFNQKMSFLRPPKGEYSERTLAITKSLEYKTVFWSFAYADWDTNNQKGADFAYEKVMKELHNGEVMLLHAVSKDNTDALDRIIKSAKELGYEFSTLDKFKQ